MHAFNFEKRSPLYYINYYVRKIVLDAKAIEESEGKRQMLPSDQHQDCARKTKEGTSILSE